ncbi:hypothetical protein [Sphaerospermopsis torques-reginae]|uniref:Uncharacterized protein n=1 Tax=Sphaerospermopsis torques-reginae ITEP-024 TaxID=984208 RepID=A0ABX8X3B7_9CYAN|nr:hypothetical protein [Sphaerospermopsis torques-reginae]QYX33130.1 hypothetical protein K2F26_07330 [Sphaerospermopsis torques-reginae ITEP-024]
MSREDTENTDIFRNFSYLLPIMRLCCRYRNDAALSGVMRYTMGGQDAHPTRVLLL